MELQHRIPAILTLFMRLLELASEEDGDFDLLQHYFRQSRFLARYLERRRVTMERINVGRTVYFTTYVGTWYNQYPEVQFREDFRLSKTSFRVNRCVFDCTLLLLN